MLFLIGLGLGSSTDITVGGLEAVKKCSRVYLEHYTSILIDSSVEDMEQLYGRSVILADRDMVEQRSDEILQGADQTDVAVLVVGDPFGATTHTDLLLRAKSVGIPVRVFHNASIMNAVGACGLSLYNFGQTVSFVFFTETWKPQSFYDRILENHRMGLHTLCLLDIKVKEQSEENLARGRKIYEPPRFMNVKQACLQLLEIEQVRQEGIGMSNSLAIGVARVGAHDQTIIAGTLEQLCTADFGKPLHSLVLIGRRIHELEMEAAAIYAANPEDFMKRCKAFASHS